MAHFAPLLSPLARQQLRELGDVGSDPPGLVDRKGVRGPGSSRSFYESTDEPG